MCLEKNPGAKPVLVILSFDATDVLVHLTEVMVDGITVWKGDHSLQGIGE